VRAGLARRWRSWLYGGLTYIDPDTVARAAERRGGRLALRVGNKVLARGYVKVPGGAAGGLLLATDHLPIGHNQGWGLVRGVLEPGVQEALRRHIRPGDTVYDIGANIGFFAILGARLAGPEGRVEAFEPVPASAAAVRANAELNGLATVSVHQMAVGSSGGSATLLVPDEHSWSHLADRGWHPGTREQMEVPVIALDEEIAGGRLPPPDVIKIDVEGSEIAVLEGFRETLRTRPVTVICELHETNAEVLSLFGWLGYSIENLDGPEPVASAGAIHVLARPVREARPD
jgi:FkbM family methyltransferase